MAAARPAGNTVTIGTDRFAAAGRCVAVKRIEGFDPGAVFFKQRLRAFQISQTFLAGIRHKENSAFWFQFLLDQVFCTHHHIDQIRRVIADARCIELSVFFPHGKLDRVREYNIGVRGKYNKFLRIGVSDLTDHIFGFIDPDVLRALLFKPFAAERSPRILLM